MYTLIKSDYLQRTRSYAFLITLCASLAIAYTFVPEPNANYSTIRISDYVGYYNSAWFGYVTAIMTSIFLSLIGFYLVNSGIKKDQETRIGHIIAATSISNFKYLLAKMLSNFLILLTIVGAVFCMSLVLFVVYNDGYPFQLLQFIKPYAMITIPAMFCISAIAVVFEVFLGKYSVLQNIGFFFLFSVLMASNFTEKSGFVFDMFGSKIVIHELETQVRQITNLDEDTSMNIGYVLGNTTKARKFEFNGINFPTSFIVSRLLFMGGSIAIIALIAPLFHRFKISERTKIAVTKSLIPLEKTTTNTQINTANVTVAQINYSVFPLVKTEFLLLVRQGKKWMWLLNLLGMILLVALPLKMAHQMVLPILWFLQVSRISEISTKEHTHTIHYFTFTSYKPIQRVLFSQIAAAILLLLLLASPLLITLGMDSNFQGILSVILGGIFIVLLSTALGILSKGKKLFEVLFFMIAYANINGIPLTDYFGGFQHHNYYHISMMVTIICLLSGSVFIRKHQLSNE